MANEFQFGQLTTEMMHQGALETIEDIALNHEDLRNPDAAVRAKAEANKASALKARTERLGPTKPREPNDPINWGAISEEQFRHSFRDTNSQARQDAYNGRVEIPAQ